MSPRHRFILFAMATGISTLGSQITVIALPWLILEGSGATWMIGIASAAGVTATLVGGVPAGTITARLGVWRALLAHELAGALTIALFALVLGLGREVILIPAVLVVSVLLGVIRPILISGATLASADIVSERASLTTINGTVSSVQQIGLVLGQALGGIFITAWGAHAVIWLDAATFVPGGLLFAVASARTRPGRTQDAVATSILAGAKSLLRDHVLRTYAVIAVLISTTLQTFLFYLPAVIADVGLDARWYGWAVAATGVGAASGGLLVGPLARKYSLPHLVAVGVALSALAVFFPVIGHFSPAVIIVAMGTVGIGSSLINAPLRAALVSRTPTSQRATTIVAAFTLVTVASPLGALAAAALLALNTPPTAWAITATTALIPLSLSA